MREDDLPLEVEPEEAHQRRVPLAVGMEQLEAEAVEAEVRAAVEHAQMVVQVARAVGVAHDDRMGRDALAGQDVELLDPHRALVGVGGDRHAGLAVGVRCGAQHHLLVRRDLVGAGGHLDDAGPDAGLADPFGQLADEDVGHLLDAVAELRAELEVGGRALVLLVEPGGADDANPRRLRHLGHQLHVAPEVDGARIEERRETEVAQLEHAVDAPLRIFTAGGTVGGRFRFPARPADHEVLVHERGAQLARLDRPRDRLYLLHARHESAVEAPQSRCPVR